MGTYRLKQEFDQSRYQVDKRGSVIIVLKIKGRLYHQTIKIDHIENLGTEESNTGIYKL